MRHFLWRISFRARDFLVAFLGLILLSPLFLIVAVAIKIDSPGPVFYGGPRSGRNGKPFKIWKFRTMFEKPESYQGPKITSENDTRITKVGNWLRQSKLNEIPQLWNMLVGEMGLVGPRPEDPELVKTWPKEVQEEILSIRPGITSPASVLFHDEENLLANGSLMETYFGVIQPSKIRLDQLYVRHRSFWADLDIILWTALVLLPGRFETKPRERQLYGGVLQRGMTYLTSWFVIDFIVALIAISISGIGWRIAGPLDIGVGKSILEAFYFAIVFTIIGAMVGIQKIHWSKASPTEIIRLLSTFFIATFFLLAINYFTKVVPTTLLLSGTVLTFFGLVITRFRLRLITGTATQMLRIRKSESLYQERVLIVGSGDAGSFAAWMLRNSREGAKFKLVGYLDDDFNKQGARIYGVDVLGDTGEIEAMVKKYDIGVILFAIHNIDKKTSKKIKDRCEATSAQVIYFPDVIGNLSQALTRNSSEVKTHPRNETVPAGRDFDEMLTIVERLKSQIDGTERSASDKDLARLQHLIEQKKQETQL